MASWSRAFVIKTAFLACVVLLILFNFYNFRFESRTKYQTSSLTSMNHPRTSTTEWTKRIRSNADAQNNKMIKLNDGNGSVSNSTITSPYPKIPVALDLIGNDTRHPLHSTSTVINATKAFGSSSDKFNQTGDIGRTNTKEPSASTTSINDIGRGAKHLLQKIMTSFGMNSCPPIPPNLQGPIEVDTTYEKMETIEMRLRDKLLPGGAFKPTECNAKDRVAIVIPYRDRAHHLPIFLKNIHPFLMKQQIEYGIFVVEQIADGLFNRAALMNIGFLEAGKLNNWDCFIFHDVDLLPMDDRNLYTCPDQPRHMSVAVDTMGFKLPYNTIFGGVSAMTVKQFRTVNGFSNSFWGWGGEDDDMSNRLKHVGYHIARYPVNIARYTMLNHRKEKANPRRYEKLVNGVKKFDTEGLNSLKYKIKYLEHKILYTWILVDIRQDSSS